MIKKITGFQINEETGKAEERNKKEYYFVKVYETQDNECKKWIQLPKDNRWRFLDVSPGGNIVVASNNKIVITHKVERSD